MALVQVDQIPTHPLAQLGKVVALLIVLGKLAGRFGSDAELSCHGTAGHTLTVAASFSDSSGSSEAMFSTQHLIDTAAPIYCNRASRLSILASMLRQHCQSTQLPNLA